MAEYRAIKLKAPMTQLSQGIDILVPIHKALVTALTTMFNGFTQIGTWESASGDSPNPDTTDEMSFKGYFNLDGGNDKQIMFMDYILRSLQSDPIYLSGENRFGVVRSNHTGRTYDGIYTVGNFGFYNGVWNTDGYEHWLMAYLDDSDLLVGFSTFQKLYDYGMLGAVMLFNRNNGKIFTTGGIYADNSVSQDAWVANYRGNDLTPQGKFTYSGKGISDPYVISESVIIKDMVDNFTKYEGSVPLMSFGNYDINDYRLNQRITVGNQMYIHLGVGRLFMPISSYSEVTVQLE